jgi:hypothetical protein
MVGREELESQSHIYSGSKVITRQSKSLQISFVFLRVRRYNYVIHFTHPISNALEKEFFLFPMMKVCTNNATKHPIPA